MEGNPYDLVTVKHSDGKQYHEIQLYGRTIAAKVDAAKESALNMCNLLNDAYWRGYDSARSDCTCCGGNADA